ncbi:MAG: S8 family serine peptidase, partial [Nanoarchaeota archaeon]|nr:S8 family serine peptidase [Nanoarchaeota archaeon]
MKFIPIILVLILSFSTIIAGEQSGDTFEIIVKMKKEAVSPSMKIMSLSSNSEKLLEDAIRDVDGKVKNKFTSFNGFSANVNLEEYNRLKNNPNVESIETNYRIAPHLVNATSIMSATNSWNLKSLSINLTGTHQTVCILDTGVNYSHPDFGGCNTSDFTSGNCAKIIGGYDITDNDNDVMDYVGHGTHVAGIVAANGGLKGISPDANIVMVKIFNDTGAGSGADIISGIEWCTNNAS